MPKKRFLIISGCILILAATSLFLGNIPPSPLYYLKVSRESIQTLFIFGDEDKANWLLTRADKRLVEAEKLKTRHLDYLVRTQTNIAKDYQRQAQYLLTSLKDKTNITYLKDRYNQNDEKIEALQGN